MIFHVHEVEKVNWRTVQYFLPTKWKSLTGEIYDTSCTESAKVGVENSTVFHVHEVEN